MLFLRQLSLQALQFSAQYSLSKKLKIIQLSLLILFSMSTLSANAAREKFKPFVLSEISHKAMDKLKTELKGKIKQSPFSIIAEYSPYKDAYIYIITSDRLKALASESSYGGFAAPQRISLTKTKNEMIDEIQISYTNPVFMQHAYRMYNADMQPVLEQMKQSFGFKEFFGGKGLSSRQLKRYSYSFGLEDFDSFFELPKYGTYKEALNALNKGFADKSNGISLVYKLKIPNKNQTVFGVSMSASDSGDEELNVKKTMTIIDHLPLKRTAYLPYEIMVDENRIIALHARFRIAAYFYDLMMFGKHGFGKLMSTPTAYKNAFILVSGGTLYQPKMDGNGFIDY